MCHPTWLENFSDRFLGEKIFTPEIVFLGTVHQTRTHGSHPWVLKIPFS